MHTASGHDGQTKAMRGLLDYLIGSHQ
jgi:hypothetical protein